MVSDTPRWGEALGFPRYQVSETLQADGSVFQRMNLGRQAHRLVARARELDPEHPRARLQLGILLFHTPSMFGGGPDAALPHLREARTALDPIGRTDPPTWPDWGWHDASAWTGQTLAALGRPEEARGVYVETLEREPEMRWIRDALLPDLDD